MSTEPDVATGTPDPSPYIRTYAKDVAAFTGQSPVNAATSVGAEVTGPAPRHDDSLIVSEAPSSRPADLSKLEQDAERINVQQESEREAEERLQDLGNAPSSGLLQSISLPDIQPGDIIPGAAPASESADREAVLARLRAKVATKAGSVPTVQPQQPIASQPAPVVVARPVAPPAPPPPPPPQPVSLPEQSSALAEASKPSPFHSFSSDFADRIDAQGASTFSVLAAEKDARTPTPAPQPQRRSSLLVISAGIVLIIAGAGGVFAAYRFMTATAPVAATPSISSLIVPDEKVQLSGTSTTLLAALAAQANQTTPTDTVVLTYITTATTTKQGIVEAPATGGALITELSLPAPDILFRNTDPSSMVGIVNDGTQTRAFFILRVTSYERTFAGMLAWEPTIGKDLAALYPAYPAPVVQAPVMATSTATTTKTSAAKKVATTTPTQTTTSTSLVQSPQFVDEVVSNHSARALKDSSGRTVLIYGYADQQTLIIARDEAAFTLLLARLEASQH
ncbi:MAG: hypothetical protein P4M11_06355 [Candidatus Pacebacteria bacterium]|nr:hypothetical protein [Candidatus Paceibacterota bacterium]